MDYQILLQEIEEAETLCQGNWIEIEKQYNYILELQAILNEHGIDYPILL
nr:mobility-associated LCxxNW protein [Butyrivibrio fibrisolvens]